MRTCGLDKIVERDDEGGGEQVEFEETTILKYRSLPEQIDSISVLKHQLQRMIDAYESKISL